MFFYGLYLLGFLGSRLFPLRASYWIARRLADFCYFRSAVDRKAVLGNLESILGEGKVTPPPEGGGVTPAMVREVFRNFGMYLVDFFRFGRLTTDRVRRMVRLEGVEHMEAALRQGKGAIGLSAHLGNFELAGAVLALLGLPVNAVVLTHSNPYVNAFFSNQREKVGVKGIPLNGATSRASYQACADALARNEILALVGDRDFSSHGLPLPFCGREIKIPNGPAAFSLKTGAPIVPGFLIRENGGSFRFVLERPITVPQGLPREEAQAALTQECLNRMSHYIRRYPTQWYMFQKFWSPGPATIL